MTRQSLPKSSASSAPAGLVFYQKSIRSISRIKSKLQQIESLNELATSCTITYSDMPRNPNHGGSKVERAVLKIIELQESLKKDVEDLVELKEQIMATIQSVADVELQTLLEKRYLCFLSWEKIAVEMHYSHHHES